ncbi:MAG: hypothetical protein ACLP7P_08520 [Rhodomicrobium sp.]
MFYRHDAFRDALNVPEFANESGAVREFTDPGVCDGMLADYDRSAHELAPEFVSSGLDDFLPFSVHDFCDSVNGVFLQ